MSLVSSMLKTVRNVEEESSKVVKSLENTIDAIDGGLDEYASPDMVSNATPEDLMRSTKVGWMGVVICGSAVIEKCL